MKNSVIVLIVMSLYQINSWAIVSASQSTTKPLPVLKYSFQFKNLKNNIVKVASTEQAAFRLAASECYEVLTNGQYPGEEKGLVIIDICANPKIKLL